MTRGAIILKKGKEILSACELRSDAYPNGDYGRKVYQAFVAMDPKEAFTSLTATCGNPIDIEKNNIDESWWNISKLSKEARVGAFFDDYSYVYDYDLKKLTIFYYGKKVYSFCNTTKFDREYLFLLVEDNNDAIGFGLAYNDEKKDFSLERHKEFARLIKKGKTPDEIHAYAKGKIAKIRYIYDSSNCIDHVNRDNFINRVGFPAFDRENGYLGTGQPVHLIYEWDKYTKHWRILLQLPWYRQNISHRVFPSKKAAVKAGREYVDLNWNRLKNLPKLDWVYRKANEGISKFYNENSNGLDRDNKEDLKKFDSFAEKLNKFVEDNLTQAGFNPMDDEISNPENFCKEFSPKLLRAFIVDSISNLYQRLFVHEFNRNNRGA